MPQRKCCVSSCSYSCTNGAILHYFPNPSSDPERFNIWLTKAGLAGEDHNHIFKNKRICRIHFEDMYLYPKNRLSRMAIPTLHLSDFNQQQNFNRPPTKLTKTTLPLRVAQRCKLESTSVYKAPTPANPTPVNPTPAPSTPAPPTPAPPISAPTTPATPAPKLFEPKLLQLASPDEVDPLAPDVKSEHEDSDTETEEPVYDETIKEHVTAVPLADEPKVAINTVSDANPVTPELKCVVSTSDADNIAAQTQAVTSQPQMPPKIVLRRVDLNAIKTLNRPKMKLTFAKCPLSVLQRWKLDNQKQVVHPTAQLPQSDSTASLTNLPPHDIEKIKILNQPVMRLTKTTCPLSLLLRLKLDNQKQVVHPTAQLQQSDSTASLTNLPPHDMVQKRLLTDFVLTKKENLALRKELNTLRKRNKLLENRLIKLKQTKQDRKAMFDKLTAHMSAPAKALFEMQFQSKKKRKGRRYSLPGRIIALSIYKASPACYAMLSKYFVLPSRRVLKDVMASARKETAAAETTIANETDPNEPENEEKQEMLLDGECEMDGINDLDLNGYNINIQYETSKVVDNIVNETQATNKESQNSQATEEDIDQMTDDTSEVQTVELCEGEALQLADGRIFQLIDGQIVEVVGELEKEVLNVPSDETSGTGPSDELNQTVNDPQSTQVCEQGTFIVKPLRRYGRARDELSLQNETPLLQDNVSSTQQTTIDHYQQSHRDTSPLSMTSKPNSFDGRPANVDELCISNQLRSQVGEQATEIQHPHRTKQHHTKHKQATKETSSFPDMSRMVTLPVTNLKRVATDKEPLTSPTSAAQLYRVQQCYRKHLKTNETTSRGPDMPDLTFS